MKPVNPKEAIEAIASLDSTHGRACISPADWVSAPTETLQTLILTRMNLVKNIKRDIDVLVERMAEQLADAKVAEMLLRLRTAAEKEPTKS